MASKSAVKIKKAEIIKKHSQKGTTDSGCPEAQVALLTDRILGLTDHAKKNPNDQHTKKGLLRLVSQRKRTLLYLRNKSAQRYTQLIQTLGLRK